VPIKCICTILFIAVMCTFAFAQKSEVHSERDSVVAALEVLYGPSLGGSTPRFRVSSDHILTLAFSADGVLIRISVEPSARTRARDPQLPAAEFERMLSKLDSVKRIGGFVEDGFSWASGKSYQNKRYENAYISTAELRLNVLPRPIYSATISYVHRVVGVPRFPKGSNPKGINSFALVCINGYEYTVPNLKAEWVLLNGDKAQTIFGAGPLGEKSVECR
jgi:hypothetical protein